MNNPRMTYSKLPYPPCPSYTVDTDGNVFGKHGKKLKGSKCNKRALANKDLYYIQIGLRFQDGTRRFRMVHRMVLETFVGPRPAGMVGRHLDGNPSNNALNNIEWGTQTTNLSDRKRHGTTRGPRGELNGKARLSEEDVQHIRDLLRRGKTQETVATMFDVKQAAISKIKLGKTWGHLKNEN